MISTLAPRSENIPNLTNPLEIDVGLSRVRSSGAEGSVIVLDAVFWTFRSIHTTQVGIEKSFLITIGDGIVLLQFCCSCELHFL